MALPVRYICHASYSAQTQLTFLGSIIQTPPSDTASSFEKTPGKTQMALPTADPRRPPSQIEWEVEEFEDPNKMKEVEMVPRSYGQ